MKKLDIIYEDKNILVVNKPSKMLTISDGTNASTLYEMAREYVKKKHKSNKIFIVHRLDKDTSGVVLFAKTEEIKKELQNNWNDLADREYIAILEGNLKEEKGVIKNYLLEDRTHKVYISKNKKGEYAETHFEVINRTNKNTVVRIFIKTGKKNQIRVAFASLNHPIIGDKKYGSKSNPIKRLGLHASKLIIQMDDKEQEFCSKLPDNFTPYCKKRMKLYKKYSKILLIVREDIC